MKTKVKLETEKEINIADLKNTDHIGFAIYGKDKCYVINSGEGKVKIISVIAGSGQVCNCLLDGGKDHTNVIDAISGEKHRINELYVFTTRKELYQWLAE